MPLHPIGAAFWLETQQPKALVPTLASQRLFQPALVYFDDEEALGAEDIAILHWQVSADQR